MRVSLEATSATRTELAALVRPESPSEFSHNRHLTKERRKNNFLKIRTKLFLEKSALDHIFNLGLTL
jgi:hypothetical protein